MVTTSRCLAPRTADRPELAGTVEQDDVASFSDSAAGVSGEFQTRVVRGRSGMLDFYFRVRSLSGSDLWSASWNLVGPAVSIDVDYRLDGLGEIGPDRAYRQDFGSDATGHHVSQLGWYFGGSLAPGSSSRFVFVKTDATDYSRYDGTSVWQAPLAAYAPVDHYG
jgi:hypothetical protein